MGLAEIQALKEKAKLPKEKKVYTIPKVSKKKQMQLLNGGNDNDELESWFIEQRKNMKGKCEHCGEKSCMNDDKYYKFSIAHILPKKIFKSVATHKDNWIELCFWGSSCHTNYDNFTLDITDLHCFDQVIERFISIYPSISKEEKRFIPDTLKQYIPLDI